MNTTAAKGSLTWLKSDICSSEKINKTNLALSPIDSVTVLYWDRKKEKKEKAMGVSGQNGRVVDGICSWRVVEKDLSGKVMYYYVSGLLFGFNFRPLCLSKRMNKKVYEKQTHSSAD